MRSRFLFLALSLGSCAGEAGDEACDCDADALVSALAAPGAVECGRATSVEAREAVTACVEDAIARGQPFVGAWSRQGIDSELRTYVIEDASGDVWIFGYDGNVSDWCPTLHGSRCTTPLERRTFGLDGEALACDQSPTSDQVLCERAMR